MIRPPRHMSTGEKLTAQHYNALLDFVRRITPIAGENTRVDYVTGGARINGTPAGASDDDSGPRPFDVRNHDGQWEIYLPSGSVSAGRDLKPANIQAKSVDGHQDDDEAWRLLRLDESDGRVVSSDGGRTVRRFVVTVHAKPFCQMLGEDSLYEETPTGYVFAEAHADQPGDGIQEDELSASWGDAFSFAAAEVDVVSEQKDGGDASVSIIARRLQDGPVVVRVQPQRAFELVWWFRQGEDGTAEVRSVYCVFKTASAAGTSIEDELITDVAGARDVYLHITSNMGKDSGEVVSDPDDTTSDDANTWARLYRLDGNRVVADFRTESLSNIQIYR